MRPPSVFLPPLLYEEAVDRGDAAYGSSWTGKVTHDFNERGMDSLRPRYRPGRITTEQRQRSVGVAGARPAEQEVTLARWSLPRLSVYLEREGIQGSPRHLGGVLAEAGLSFQRTRTWKAGPVSALSEFVVCNADCLDWERSGTRSPTTPSSETATTATGASPPPKPAA